MKTPFVKIIGAGISGFSCGVLLLDAGFCVTIVSNKDIEHTTSAAAAGIWMPYHAGNHPRTDAWARATYAHCEAMQSVKNSGVFFINHKKYFLTSDKEIEKLYQELDSFYLLKAENLKYGADRGYGVSVPVMPSNIYLSFLAYTFLEKGGMFKTELVNDIMDAAADADLLVNCSGYGARKLCKDEDLSAAKGHVVIVSNPGIHENIVVTQPGSFTHIFPFGDKCILGGVYQHGNEDLTPDPDMTARIMERVLSFEPIFNGVETLGVRTGLRPVRPSVKLELELLPSGKPVIHNYGHGGAGYTLAQGCAQDVTKIAKAVFFI